MDAPLAPTEPLEMLADLFVSVHEGRPPAVTTADWFVRGMLHAARDGVQMEQAFRLVSSAGGRSGSLARQLKLYQRDQFLLQALDLVALDDVGAWRRCLRLSDELQRFERAEWPANKHRDRPPDQWTALRIALWSALRVGLGVPTTPEGLYRVAKQRGPCFKSGESLKVLTQYL